MLFCMEDFIYDSSKNTKVGKCWISPGHGGDMVCANEAGIAITSQIYSSYGIREWEKYKGKEQQNMKDEQKRM